MAYNLKIISSGNNRLEIYKISDYEIREGKIMNPEGRRGKDSVTEEQKEMNTKRGRKTTLNNARNEIIRLIKSNDDMNTFITLTYAYDVEYKQSKIDLNTFFNKLRRKYKDLKYIWVIEFTERKRIHYHLLTNIPIDIRLSKSNERKSEDHKALENNFRHRYWKHGFIDIRKLDEEGNTNVALYVSCYITKFLLEIDLQGDRCYGYSRKTLNKPIVTTLIDDRPLEILLKDFEENYYILYQNEYEIGYVDDDGKEHKGTTNYFDMEIKNKE